MLPIFLALAYNNKHVSEVLRVSTTAANALRHVAASSPQVGWTPVLMAMVIASGGGFVLEMAVEHFKGVTLFGESLKQFTNLWGWGTMAFDRLQIQGSPP